MCYCFVCLFAKHSRDSECSDAMDCLAVSLAGYGFHGRMMLMAVVPFSDLISVIGEEVDGLYS